MKHCFECGAALIQRWMASEGRERAFCPACDAVRYENPRVLVSSVISHEKKLLLCRRAQNPSMGKWNLPSGFLELGETLEVAAARETLEETGVHIEPGNLHLYTVTSLAKISEVYVCFRGAVESDQCVAGVESLEVRFFAEAEVPWNDLAFPEMFGFLRLFFVELKQGDFGIHLSRVDERGRFRREYRLVSGI
jgi:ADP-ribose pyrophosphatase YjhB (NUDIX family)